MTQIDEQLQLQRALINHVTMKVLAGQQRDKPLSRSTLIELIAGHVARLERNGGVEANVLYANIDRTLPPHAAGLARAVYERLYGKSAAQAAATTAAANGGTARVFVIGSGYDEVARAQRRAARIAPVTAEELDKRRLEQERDGNQRWYDGAVKGPWKKPKPQAAEPYRTKVNRASTGSAVSAAGGDASSLPLPGSLCAVDSNNRETIKQHQVAIAFLNWWIEETSAYRSYPVTIKPIIESLQNADYRVRGSLGLVLTVLEQRLGIDSGETFQTPAQYIVYNQLKNNTYPEALCSGKNLKEDPKRILRIFGNQVVRKLEAQGYAQGRGERMDGRGGASR